MSGGEHAYRVWGGGESDMSGGEHAYSRRALTAAGVHVVTRLATKDATTNLPVTILEALRKKGGETGHHFPVPALLVVRMVQRTVAHIHVRGGARSNGRSEHNLESIGRQPASSSAAGAASGYA